MYVLPLPCLRSENVNPEKGIQEADEFVLCII